MEDDIKTFVREISEKLNKKLYDKDKLTSDITQTVRDMVAHKLQKEGWVKGSNKN